MGRGGGGQGDGVPSVWLLERYGAGGGELGVNYWVER